MVRIPATAVWKQQQSEIFALFGQFSFLEPLLTELSSFASLFYWCMCFALIISFIGGYGKLNSNLHWKGIFLVFLAWSSPSSLTIHFLGINNWVMCTQLFKSCKMTPLWINFEWIHFPSYTVNTEIRRIYGAYTAYIRSYTAYILYMEIPCTVWPTLHMCKCVYVSVCVCLCVCLCVHELWI